MNNIDNNCNNTANNIVNNIANNIATYIANKIANNYNNSNIDNNDNNGNGTMIGIYNGSTMTTETITATKKHKIQLHSNQTTFKFNTGLRLSPIGKAG